MSNYSEDKRTKVFSAIAAMDYSFYCEYVHRGSYVHGAHTKYICDKLHDVETGKIKRMMVWLPPRHSKSMSISETFPSWFIGRKPSRKVIVTSYGDSLARRFGRLNRKKVSEFGSEIFGITLDQASSPVTNWTIDKYGGQMLSAGIGGPITGEGADLLIIDDPFKNRQEADSATYRNMVWDEWQNTLLTRLQPNGAIIIVMTRWHEDDLGGRLLNTEKDRWEVISFPCLAEKDDLLGRDIDAPLWPEFGFDYEWALDRKSSVGTYGWQALYQQRPSPPEGSILHREWWKYYTEIPTNFNEIIQSWDMAFTNTKTSSFVVGQVWGRKDGNFYLIDQVRKQMDFVETTRQVERLSEKWPEAKTKLIEDKANGPALLSSLRNKVSGMIPITPKGSKEARTHAISPYVEAGNVWLPRKAPWVDDFIEECAVFPNGVHDDQVDATTQALQRLGKGRTRITVGSVQRKQ